MNDNNSQARTEALLTLEQFTAVPTSIISYQSNGRVLVFGAESDIALCNDFAKPLKLTRVPVSATSKKLRTLDQREIEISGHLGQFVVQLVDQQGENETLRVDLVLDLNPVAALTQEILPPGYLHREIGTHNVATIETELLELIGEFEKPKYFNYNPNICAHGVNGATFCTNCIDACPTSAITSLVDKIEVDPFLCQGGGTCATVCPSGAIQYVYPRLTDSGNQVRKMLASYREQGGSGAIVAFHCEENLAPEPGKQFDGLLPVRVEELASVGMDLCLSTLVYGASRVVLVANPQVPALSLRHLEHQVEWVAALLLGLGLNPGLVSIQRELQALPVLNPEFAIKPAIYSMPDNKRNAMFQAIDHLAQHSESRSEIVDLPAGAPFGTATIDENKCTLCMACVGACPGKALQDGSNREMPEVFFIESHCIQCGVCTETCPEDAITISPRMVFDRELRNQSRALNQDTPFACISCGKPFAPTSVIHKMNEKLKDHYMFQTTRALDRLKMCEDCRVVDIVQDPEAMRGKFDSIN